MSHFEHIERSWPLPDLLLPAEPVEETEHKKEKPEQCQLFGPLFKKFIGSQTKPNPWHHRHWLHGWDRKRNHAVREN